MVIWGHTSNRGNCHIRRGYPVVKEGVTGVVFYGYPWLSVVIRGVIHGLLLIIGLVRPHKVNFLFLVRVRVRVHLVSFPDIRSLGTRHSCPGFPIAHAQHIHVSGSG